MGTHILAISLFVLKMLLIPRVSGSPYKRVNTPLGIIIGKAGVGGFVFQGIPFAKPPCRFEDPEYPDSFSSPFIAYGGVNQVQCPQLSCGGDTFTCLSQISEDCLYLNIFTPLMATPSSQLPVMVYIPGGGFGIGSGLVSGFNGETLASLGNVIVVSINYRLGKKLLVTNITEANKAVKLSTTEDDSISEMRIWCTKHFGVLGFLATGQGRRDLKGNYGIKDQKMALYWVNQNIASFGGDPDKVTLFGQSAGAQSIGVHLSTENHYFDRAIMQSAPFNIPFRSYDDAFIQAQYVAFLLGCPNIVKTNAIISCLKSKTMAEIITAQTSFESSAIEFTSSFLINFFQQWGPVIDNELVPMNLMDSIKENRFAKKDIILGTTSEEAVFYIDGFSGIIPYIKVLSIARELGIDPWALSALYPPSNALDARPEFEEMATDFMFLCSNRLAAKYLTKKRKVWLYIYDHVISNTTYWELLGSDTCRTRVCHSADLPIIFSSPLLYNNTYFTPDETDMALSMIGYWTNFATSANPNQPRNNFLNQYVEPNWQKFKRNKQRNLEIKTPQNDLSPISREIYCDFYENQGVY